MSKFQFRPIDSMIAEARPETVRISEEEAKAADRNAKVGLYLSNTQGIQP